MEYNTERNKLKLKEYGRHVQRMIEYTATIEDKEKRQEMAEAIVDMMGHLNPQYKNVDEFKHKLWDHLHIVSDWTLEVEAPYPVPQKEVLEAKPKHIGYPKHKIKYKHYGQNVQTMIDKAVAMEDKEKQQAFAETIGNYMKLVYKNWNQDSVNDEMIIGDIKTMSDGKLVLTEDTNLDTLTRSTRTRTRPTSSSRSNKPSRSKGGKGKSNSGTNRNYKRRKKY